MLHLIGEERLDPYHHPMADTKLMDFEPEPVMIDFIEGLAEIHGYDVSLVKGVI